MIRNDVIRSPRNSRATAQRSRVHGYYTLLRASPVARRRAVGRQG
jgi:hypothetical protein